MANAPSMIKCIQTARDAGFEHKIFSPSELQDRYPCISIPPGNVALWSPDAGVLHASKCVRALQSAAITRGARLLDNECVTRLDPGKGECTVYTSAGNTGENRVYRSKSVVLCCGAWSNTVMDRLGLGLQLPISVWRTQYALNFAAVVITSTLISAFVQLCLL